MTVGTQLQQARRERKLSLADVTKATKIQPWVLESLEADQLQDMMSPIYVKGFLSTYAKFLHLEAESLIGQVSWTKPQVEPVQPQSANPSIPVTIHWPSARAISRWVVGLAAAAAVVALVASHPLQRLHRAVAQKPSKTKRVAAAETVSRKLASVTPMGEPVSTPKPPPLAIPSNQPLEVMVAAHRTTWVQVRADGKLLTQQRLQRGANERWVAKKQLEIVIAKPGEVDVNLNGEPISTFAVAHHGRLMITHRGITQLPDEES